MTNEAAPQLINYIQTQVIRKKGITIGADTPLVSSGLVDSLALVDILAEVEKVTKMRIPAGKVQPKDMDTVNLMLATAARVGKPRG
ncbi:MAG TPA: acyl carrier protein [Terriglobales bacterium]|nr:acyl carrier protein [Terriglobales bacterium]